MMHMLHWTPRSRRSTVIRRPVEKLVEKFFTYRECVYSIARLLEYKCDETGSVGLDCWGGPYTGQRTTRMPRMCFVTISPFEILFHFMINYIYYILRSFNWFELPFQIVVISASSSDLFFCCAAIYSQTNRDHQAPTSSGHRRASPFELLTVHLELFHKCSIPQQHDIFL